MRIAFQRIPNVCRIARVAWQRSNPWQQLGCKRTFDPNIIVLNVRDGDKMKKKNKEICCFLVFTIALLIVACFHEPWYDEAEAWQMARGASIRELLFYIPHYEGHPALWYLILAVPAKLGVPYEVGLKLISCTAAVCSCALILFYSPFPKIIRCILPFHYFFFYQYAVVSRPYCLMVLCFWLMACFYRRKDEKPLRFIIPMILLCMLSGYGIVLSGGICIAWVWDICREKEWKFFRPEFWKDRRILCLVILLIVAILMILEILPYPDTIATSKQAANPLIIRMFYTFFAMLADSTVITILKGAMYLSQAPVAVPIMIFGVVMGGILLIGLIGISNGKNLHHFLIPYSLFALFSALVYFCAHHMGLVLVFAVYWLWISWEEPDRFAVWKRMTSKVTLTDQDRKTVKKVGVAAGVLMFAIPVFWTIAGSYLDIRYPFYYGRDAAAFIREHGLENAVVYGEWDIAIPKDAPENGDVYEYMNTELIARPVAILPYFKHNFVVNMGGDSHGYALHRKPGSQENREKIEEWKKLPAPEVIIGPMAIGYLTDDEQAGANYVAVYEYQPFLNIWKSNLSIYNLGYKEYIYLRKDLLETYGLKELKLY